MLANVGRGGVSPGGAAVGGGENAEVGGRSGGRVGDGGVYSVSRSIAWSNTDIYAAHAGLSGKRVAGQPIEDNRGASGADIYRFENAVSDWRIRRTSKGIAKSSVGNSGRSESNESGHLIGERLGPGGAAVIRAVDTFSQSLRKLGLRADKNHLGIRGIHRNVADARAAERKEAKRRDVIVRPDEGT